MSSSTRSNGSRNSVSLSKSDYLFLLSWKGKVAKSNSSILELKALLGNAITEQDQQALQRFKTNDEDFTAKLTREGWFHKTYESIQHYVQTYLKERFVTYPIYNQPPSSLVANKAQFITKLLKFYYMKGIDIQLEELNLTDEQEEVASFTPSVTTRNNGDAPAAVAPSVSETNGANAVLVSSVAVAPAVSSSSSNATNNIIAVSSGPGTGKTTGAIHYTKRRMDDGVICVAYTNASSKHFERTLKNIVNDIEKVDSRMKRKKRGTSEDELEAPKIYVCTIDSLAMNFVNGIPKDDQFDLRIVQATENIPRNDKILFEKDGSNAFNHIVVDEAQDLTKERFTFIMAIFNVIRCNARATVRPTIAFFGDPRQRLSSRAGAEFQKLLTETPGVVVKSFTQSFRFANSKLLDVCNALSSVRPNIHIEMTSAIPFTLIAPVKVFSTPDDVAATILALIKENNVLPHQICMISPAPHQGTVKSTREAKEIINVLASQNVVCSKEWQEDAIYYTSIQGVKGLEFDYVFFIGANNFPEGFNKVYGVDDALGLNFVANTRAKKEMFYLSDKTFAIPMNVPSNLTENGTTGKRFPTKYNPREAIKTDEIDESDYRKFESCNEYHQSRESSNQSHESNNEFVLHTREVRKLDRMNKPYIYELISAIIAVKGGKTLVQRIEEVLVPAKTDFNKNKRLTTIYDLVTSDPTNIMEVKSLYICKEDDELHDELSETYPVEAIEKHRKFHRLMKGSDSELGDMKEISNNVMSLASLLNGRNVYQSVVGATIKASCIICDTAILVFSSSFHLCSLVKSLNIEKKVYAVTSNAIVEITDAPYQVHRYKYYVNALYTITCQKHIINEKAMSSSFDKPCFFVDTEFLSVKNDKRKTIYDIAVINGLDMYQSIVSMVDCGKEVFQQIAVGHQRCGGTLPFGYEDLRGSPNIDQIFDKFCTLLSNYTERPTVYYYNISAKHDTAWITEQFDNNGSSDGSNCDYGVDLVDAMTIGDPSRPKLDVNYNRITASDCSTYRHILRHTAVSDAVLLLTMVRTVLHPIAT